MNNTLTTLAFSIYSNKGVYALMLASGVSRAAAIPTGWDITMDLIQKLAKQNGEKNIEDEKKWFIEKYNEKPDYSALLSKLVSTQTERVNLLRSYFEPSEEDLENNLKQPTKAHKSIAKLVKEGYIKVIVTTNFDRLMENALEEIGITPQVICHSDDILKTTPLVHAPITIIKINGDYLDCRFLNTKEELNDYPEKMKNYVLRIFNEFGLITCGWSGQWDTGLINILKQSKNLRYNSFFTYVHSCEKELSELAKCREGKTIEVSDADSFFYELSERIEALENANDDHPLNKEITIARIKKYLPRPECIIQFHDLMGKECEKAIESIFGSWDYSIVLISQEFNIRFNKYYKSIESIIPLSILIVKYGNEEHEQLLIEILERLTIPPKIVGNFNRETVKMHFFPSIYLFYTIGISCLYFKKYILLKKIFDLKIPEFNHENSNKEPILKKINPRYFDHNTINKWLGKNYKTPLSTFLTGYLKQEFAPIIPHISDYNHYFNTFEFIISMNYLFFQAGGNSDDWVPLGEIEWQKEYMSSDNPFSLFFKQAEEMKENWPLLKAGMFNGSYNEYITLKDKVDKFLLHTSNY